MDLSIATPLILSFFIGAAVVVGAIGLTHAEETSVARDTADGESPDMLDVTGDGKTDVAVANKRGVFIFRRR